MRATAGHSGHGGQQARSQGNAKGKTPKGKDTERQGGMRAFHMWVGGYCKLVGEGETDSLLTATQWPWVSHGRVMGESWAGHGSGQSTDRDAVAMGDDEGGCC